eukprot:UN04785
MLKQIGSPNLIPVILDITNQTHLEHVFSFINDELKLQKNEKFVGLINNAGVSHIAPIGLTPQSKIKQIIRVNVIGTMSITKTFLPLILNIKLVS